jgi:uncharacterized protein YcbK (DUF882 family)
MKQKQLTKNFNISEFRCKDGTDVPDDLENNVQKLAEQLQIIRDRLELEVGRPIPTRITSGYRTQSHNTKIGGAKNSFHLKAMASDIYVEKELMQHLFILINELIDTNEIIAGGITFYRNRKFPFIHYDIQGRKRTWRT